MSPLLSGLVGVVVRAFLVWLGSRLSEHGAAPELVQRLLSGETEQQIVGWLLVALPVGYSMFRQAAHLREKVAALKLPPDATLEEIKARAALPDIRARDLQRS